MFDIKFTGVSRNPRELGTAQLAVLAGVVLYATNAVFGAWADLGGIGFAFWRTLAAVPLLALVAVVTDRRGTFGAAPSVPTSLAGTLLGISTVLVMCAAKHAPVALIALIGTLTPLLTGIYEAWRGERVSLAFCLSGVVAAAGAGYVAVTDHASHRTDLAGVLLSIGFATGFAAFLIASRQARRDASPVGFLFWSAVWAAPPAMLTALVAGVPVTDVSAHDVLALTLATCCGGTTGHLLVTGSLRLLPATTAAVIRLTQPFFAMLFGWWIVAQTPTLHQVLGGLVTVVGVGIAVLYRPRSRSRYQEPEAGL